MATPVIQAGDYVVKVDTGFVQNAFLLDDATAGVLDNTQYVLDGTTNFADVTSYVTRVEYRRGRQRDTDQFSPGTLTFILDDTLAGGILSPFDENSPYFDANQNTPGLAPLRAVEVLRDGQPLFIGNIVNYDYQFTLGGLNTVTVFVADGFYKLAQCFISQLNVTAETSGERLETVLDLPEVNLFPGALRNVDTGTVNLGHDNDFTIPEGTNALQYAQQINSTAEFGRLFMSRDGVFTFQPRIGNTLSAPVATFSDTGSGVNYNDLEIVFDADRVVNRATVTSLNDTTGTADDVASQAAFFVQARAISSSLLHTSGELDDAATYLLQADFQPRFTSVTTNFALLTSLQRDALATIDIGDTITINKMITGFGQLAEELSVEGITARIDFATGHTVTFFTAPTTIVTQLILDDPIFGELDALNVLG